MYGYKLGRLRQTRTLKSVGFQGGGGGGGGGRKRPGSSSDTTEHIMEQKAHNSNTRLSSTKCKKEEQICERKSRSAEWQQQKVKSHRVSDEEKKAVKEHERRKEAKAQRVSHEEQFVSRACSTNTTIKALQ